MKKNISAILILILTGCASVTMPTGGKKDEIPPTLISSSPSNNELNVTSKTIELTFSEDIKLKDPKEEILIVPTIGKNTLYKVKKRKLIIEPELALEPNTTYSINFRDGVQDITEGNPTENLRLAFSTGPTIDSLSISGSVHDIFSEKIPQKITIALYHSDTFDIFKHTPTYFTKSNKEGIFSIQNLKKDSYYVYAFEDKNKNLKVDSKTEKYGFLAKPINLNANKDSITLPLTTVDSRSLALTSVRHTDKNSRVRFNKQLDSLMIKGVPYGRSIYTYGSDKSELIFYNTFSKGDSIKARLIAKDSIGQKLDTIIFIRYGEIKTAQETFKTKEVDINYNTNSKTLSYIWSFNKPIASITYDSMYIRYDSITSQKIDQKKIKIDTLLNLITLETKIETPTIKDEKKKHKSPQLIIGKGGLISIEQDSSKRISKNIQLVTEEDLGSVAIKVETKHQKYLVQIITTDGKVVQAVNNVKEYTFKNLPPTDYKIRVIIDENENGKWDAGNFSKKREPEKVILYKSEDGKYSTPLRANWEVGPLLIKF